MNFLRMNPGRFCLSLWAFSAPLVALAQSKAETPPSTAAPASPSSFEIRVPEKLRKGSHKLRIRNAATGRQKVIDLSDQDFISSGAVRELMDAPNAEFQPEFSVLSLEKKVAPVDRDRAANPSAKQLTNSLVFDQPIWRELGFSSKVQSGRIVFDLNAVGGRIVKEGDTTVTSVPVPSPQDAARRRNLRESGQALKLFDIGWRALNAKRYDLSLIAFGRLLKDREDLDNGQFIQANLGMGISKFHQQGCGHVEENFKIAAYDPKNLDDVSYYRALCLVEGKNFHKADVIFKDLAKRQSPKYAESSRFFIGVMAENEERYDDAESAYMDTADFSSDPHLVTLAKQRLEGVKQLRLQKEFNKKWFLGALTLGGGYDSNAVLLPQSTPPSAYNVSNSGSADTLALFYGEVRAPFLRSIDNKVNYTFLMSHYLTDAVSKNFDIQSHDIGTSVGFNPNQRSRFGLGLGYNAVFKGPLSTSSEYFSNTYFETKWAEVSGPVENPTSDWTVAGRVGLLRQRGAAAPGFDITANAYLLSYRQHFHRKSGQTFGPGLDLEYHPASGSEVSFESATVLGSWNMPVGPAVWQLYFNQEGAMQFAPYYQSAASRKDFVMRYTGSFSRLWSTWFETRLEFAGTLSFSNEASYQYQRAQATLFLSAYF